MPDRKKDETLRRLYSSKKHSRASRKKLIYRGLLNQDNNVVTFLNKSRNPRKKRKFPMRYFQ